jgi:hypothetical protein
MIRIRCLRLVSVRLSQLYYMFASLGALVMGPRAASTLAVCGIVCNHQSSCYDGRVYTWTLRRSCRRYWCGLLQSGVLKTFQQSTAANTQCYFGILYSCAVLLLLLLLTDCCCSCQLAAGGCLTWWLQTFCGGRYWSCSRGSLPTANLAGAWHCLAF